MKLVFAVHLMAVGAAIIIGARPSYAQGNSWSQSRERLPSTITCMSVAPDGTIFAGTANNGIYISNDRGMNFRAANEGLFDLRVRAISIIQGREVRVGTETHGVFVLPLDSIDSAPWRNIVDGMRVDAMATYNGDQLYMSGRSESGGSGFWFYDFTDSTSPYHIQFYQQLSAIAVGDSGYAYGALPDGYLISYAQATDQWGYLPMPIRGARSMAVSRTGTLFVSSSAIYRSTDRGMTWDSLTGPRSTPAIIAAPDGMIFAASDAGVFGSRTDGWLWENFQRNGSPLTDVVSLAVAPSGSLYAGAATGRVYRLDYTSNVTGNDGDPVESGDSGAGSGIALAAIPTVVREGVTLRYTIAERGTVRITITGIDGRDEATYHQQHDAGTHSLRIPVDALASGLYMVRLTAGFEVAMTTMMIVR